VLLLVFASESVCLYLCLYVCVLVFVCECVCVIVSDAFFGQT
jgi:hypothetical protein